jgi:hypothetical protein
VEELTKEHEELTKEVRHLRKVTTAMQLSNKLRKQVANDLLGENHKADGMMIAAADCIDSLLREIERCRK